MISPVSGSLQHTVFLCGIGTDIGLIACTSSSGQLYADLYLCARLRGAESLGIGIDRYVVNILDAAIMQKVWYGVLNIFEVAKLRDVFLFHFCWNKTIFDNVKYLTALIFFKNF